MTDAIGWQSSPYGVADLVRTILASALVPKLQLFVRSIVILITSDNHVHPAFVLYERTVERRPRISLV